MLAARSSKAGNRKPRAGGWAICPVELPRNSLSRSLYCKARVGSFTGQMAHTKYRNTVSDASGTSRSSRLRWGTS